MCFSYGALQLFVYDQENSRGFIRVQAPQFSKVSMAVQLTEDLQAADVLTRFLSQDRYYLHALRLFALRRLFLTALNLSVFVLLARW